MNVTNQNQSLLTSEIGHYFIRMICMYYIESSIQPVNWGSYSCFKGIYSSKSIQLVPTVPNLHATLHKLIWKFLSNWCEISSPKHTNFSRIYTLSCWLHLYLSSFHLSLHIHLLFPACGSVPCQNGGTCFIVAAGYRCFCEMGYTGINCETPGKSLSLNKKDISASEIL